MESPGARGLTLGKAGERPSQPWLQSQDLGLLAQASRALGSHCSLSCGVPQGEGAGPPALLFPLLGSWLRVFALRPPALGV